MEALAERDMTADEARSCVESIKGSIGDVRSMLWELNDRKGWVALGYKSWRECVVKELGLTERRAYQLLTAAETDQVLNDSTKLPETHARELAPIAKKDPERAREIVTQLREEKGDAVTAKDIRERVQASATPDVTEPPEKPHYVSPLRDHAAEAEQVKQQVNRLKEAWNGAGDPARAQFLAWTRGL